jgi:hypothetical protein
MNFIIVAPNLFSRPRLVVGMPVRLANLCLAPVTPSARFQEKENPYLRITFGLNNNI